MASGGSPGCGPKPGGPDIVYSAFRSLLPCSLSATSPIWLVRTTRATTALPRATASVGKRTTECFRACATTWTTAARRCSKDRGARRAACPRALSAHHNSSDQMPPTVDTDDRTQARGQTYMKFIKKFYGKDVHNFGVVPGCGHNSTCIFASGTAAGWSFVARAQAEMA